MSNSITIAIDGPGAREALDEFFAIAGITGKPVVTRDGGLLGAVGAIVGIVGGVASVVSSIIEWREKWKQAHAHQRLSVTIRDPRGNRITLDDATPEEITTVLQSLHP